MSDGTDSATPHPPQVATIGGSPWWKKHLTTAQIVQFCLDVPATAIATTLKARAHARRGARGCRR